MDFIIFSASLIIIISFKTEQKIQFTGQFFIFKGAIVVTGKHRVKKVWRGVLRMKISSRGVELD